jgi:hypothetical protein
MSMWSDVLCCLFTVYVALCIVEYIAVIFSLVVTSEYYLLCDMHNVLVIHLHLSWPVV